MPGRWNLASITTRRAITEPGGGQPGVSHARRFHRRRSFLGRLQHWPGGHPYRGVLHGLSPNTRQRFPGAQDHHSLHQSLGRASHLPRLPCAAQLDRQDRAQDAGLQGSLGKSFRHCRRNLIPHRSSSASFLHPPRCAAPSRSRIQPGKAPPRQYRPVRPPCRPGAGFCR